MTNLTEQWKKGKMPAGYYYVKNEFNNIFPSDYSESYDSINDAVIKDFFTEVSEIKEVLEQVPSYEQWQAKLEENKRLKHDVGNLGYKIKNQRHEIDNRLKEINTLKELLKECKHIMSIEKDKLCKLLTKINQVLGEE